MPDRRFPIGQFAYNGLHTAAERRDLIARLEALPARVRETANALSESQLDTPYRPEGWTARQAIHHIADSQTHSYMRFKYVLAEDGCLIAPYPEDLWAEQGDARDAPVALALAQIDAVMARWIHLLRTLQDPDFARTYRHPVAGTITLDHELAMAAWHGDHHLAHARLVLAED